MTTNRRGGEAATNGGAEQTLTGALESMRRILQEVRVANRAVEQELGISGAQLFVLEELARAPVDSLNELAARTATRHSSVSTVVARLVESGLVARRVARDDARRVQLTVTPRARRLLQGAPPSAQARLLAAARALRPGQIAELGAGLDAWCEGFVALKSAEADGGRRVRRVANGRG